MIKYIHNANNSRWLVGNPDRLHRTGVDGKPFRCPFCEGNEGDTPPEVYRIGKDIVNGPGWQVRVVPNKFNITEIHEVIIHSTDHEKSIEDLPISQIELIVKTYKERINALKEKGQVYMFSNFAQSSGASLIHPHSQIVVLPPSVKPNTLELQPVMNIIEQNNNFVAYCPEFSEWPYEVWMTQVSSSTFQVQNFWEIGDREIKDLALMLQKMLKKLKVIHDREPQFNKKPYGYNFYIYPYSPFYLRIIPRFIERAGFELSTRIMVNSVSPEKAASDLKNV